MPKTVTEEEDHEVEVEHRENVVDRYVLNNTTDDDDHGLGHGAEGGGVVTEEAVGDAGSEKKAKGGVGGSTVVKVVGSDVDEKKTKKS